MNCPACGSATKINRTERLEHCVVRYRWCPMCRNSFTTTEEIHLPGPKRESPGCEDRG